METFLESLRNHPNEKVKLHYASKQDRLRVLNLFRNLFEPPPTDTTAESTTVGEALSDATQGLGQLNMQFRMHRNIAEPVRRVFYRSVPPN